MKLQSLVARLPILEKRNWKPSQDVLRIVSDSRRVKSGDLFVACPGPRQDGHPFLSEAFQKGAAVAVGERPYLHSLPGKSVYLQVTDARQALGQLLNQFYSLPSQKMQLIGITGTNGKTTIAYLMNYLLNSKIRAGYLGTLGAHAPGFRQELLNTTPGAEELYSLLGRMAEEKVQTVAMEVSSHALDQKRVEGLQFEIALFTQLTPEHLDYHDSLGKYFQAKRLLFQNKPKPRQMLINRDCVHGKRLLEENPQALSFSVKGKADYWADEIKTNFDGSEFIFEGPRTRFHCKSPLPFIHNAFNLLAAFACLDLLGFDPSDFRETLSKFPGVPGRLERIAGPGFNVFVDYAHTPDAFEHIFSEAKRLAPRKIISVFGCGGDRDPYKRPEMTRTAHHYSDLVILTSDNPRTEDPAAILRDMKKGLPPGTHPNVLEIPDREEAIHRALGLADSGDAVLILGKGHENYQILGTRKVYLDDRDIVKSWLKKTKGNRIYV